MKKIILALLLISVFVIVLYTTYNVTIYVEKMNHERFEVNDNHILVTSMNSEVIHNPKITRVYRVYEDGTWEEISLDIYSLLLPSDIQYDIILKKATEASSCILTDSRGLTASYAVSSPDMTAHFSGPFVLEQRIVSNDFRQKIFLKRYKTYQLLTDQSTVKLEIPIQFDVADEKTIQFQFRSYVSYSHLDLEYYIETPCISNDGIIGYIEVRSN